MSNETIIEWINIKDKLPSNKRNIFIYTGFCKYKICIGFFNGKDFFELDGETKMGNTEYWADIPTQI